MTTVVLTGEGAKGAFSFGVVLYLRSKGLEVSKYVGISSGSLVAALMSQIDPDASTHALQKITGISSVFSFKWDFLWSDGFYTTRPIERTFRYLLENHRLPKHKRVAGTVSYVDAESGIIHYRDINELSDEDIVESVMSAISIPGLIAPYKWPFIDAGSMEINPVTYALHKGEKSIAMILGRPVEPHKISKPTGLFKGAKIGLRAVDLMMHSMCVDDILSGALAQNDADIQLFEPINYLGEALDFHKTKEFMEEGFRGRYKRTDVVKAMKALS